MNPEYYSDPANKSLLLKRAFIKRQHLAKQMSKIRFGPFGFGRAKFNLLQSEIRDISSFERLLNDDTMTGDDAQHRVMSLYNVGQGIDHLPEENSSEVERDGPESKYFTDPANKKVLLNKSFVKRQAIARELAQTKIDIFSSEGDRRSILENELEMLKSFDNLLNDETMTGQDAFFRETSLQNISLHFGLHSI